MKHEHLKRWEADGFRLDTWDSGRVDHMGKFILRYELIDTSDAPPEFSTGAGMSGPRSWGVVFAGEDFACSPMDAIDSDKTMASILGFLSLKPGDTDADYFDDYTDKQRAWMDWRAEELSLAAMSTLPED